MVHATAQFLIAEGIARSEIPPPCLPEHFTEELASQVGEALSQAVGKYGEFGGTLIARRACGHLELLAYMGLLWREMAPDPIEKTSGLPAYEKEHERVARASCAAQALMLLLEEHNTLDPTDPGYWVKDTEVESFCVQAVRVMEEVYNAPDKWVHEKLHGGGQ